MNIILVSSGSPDYDRFPPGGGIQYQIYHTANELARLGHEPVVVTRNAESDAARGVSYEEIEVPLNDEIVSRMHFGHRARQLVASERPDLVLAYERFSAARLSSLGPPVLFFTSNPDAMKFYRSFARDRHPLNYLLFPVKNWLEERVMCRADRVVALNESIEEYLNSRRIHNTTVIPNAVNVEDYRTADDDDFFLFAGRLNQVKGCGSLLAAFYEISDAHPEMDLVFAGEGELRGQLEEETKAMGLSDRVNFTGWLEKDDLVDQYSRCTAFVLPSQFEMSPVSLLEAMASEKPVVASEIMGPRDIVTDGKDGLLFEAGNTSELAEQLHRVVEDGAYRQRLGAEARKTAESRHSFQNITEQILRVEEGLG